MSKSKNKKSNNRKVMRNKTRDRNRKHRNLYVRVSGTKDAHLNSQPYNYSIDATTPETIAFVESSGEPGGISFMPILDGSKIKTNYFETAQAKCGLIQMISMNSIFHLLLPSNITMFINEMKTGKHCIISYLPSAAKDEIGLELFFDDDTEYPFCIELGSCQCTPIMIGDGNMYTPRTLKVWNSKCEEKLSMTAFLRKVEHIPYRRTLGE